MAGGAEAGDRRGVLCSGVVGGNGCSTLRRECDQVAPMPLFKRLQATKLLTGEACSLVSRQSRPRCCPNWLRPGRKKPIFRWGRTDIESTVTPRLGAADVNLRL